MGPTSLWDRGNIPPKQGVVSRRLGLPSKHLIKINRPHTIHTVHHLDLISSHQTEREGQSPRRKSVLCFTGRERESHHLRPLSSALPSPPLVLFPTAIDMRWKWVWSVFFFNSDFISLWERLYFLISSHFLFVFCSDCILLHLVAVERKAGFSFLFFGFWFY